MFFIIIIIIVQLTMEEKARLARDQDMQQRLKSQVPLQLQSTTMTSTSNKPTTSTRDLSSTLSTGFPLQTGLSSNQSPASSFPSAVRPMGSVGWATSGSSAGLANNQAVSKLPESSKKVDLSSFDDLITVGNKPRPSLASMAPPQRELHSFGTPSGGIPQFGAPMGGMPQFGAPSNSGMSFNMSSNLNSASSYGITNHSQVGVGTSTMMAPRPMYGGNMGFPLAAGSQQPPMTNAQAQGSTPLSNKDIADFLG